MALSQLLATVIGGQLPGTEKKTIDMICTMLEHNFDLHVGAEASCAFGGALTSNVSFVELFVKNRQEQAHQKMNNITYSFYLTWVE